MRRGRATTAIEGASDSGLKTPRPQFAPKVCKQLMRRLLSIPFARFLPAGKSVKAWHPVTLLRICTGVPDFF